MRPAIFVFIICLCSVTPAATTSRVFATSISYNGNLGGLSGADSKCQTRAVAAGLSGTWKAWLSVSTSSAALRLPHATGFYRRVDGVVIAHNWADLADGELMVPLNRNEFSAPVAGGVWTATDEAGNYVEVQQFGTPCNNFSSIIGAAIAGDAGSFNGGWTNGGGFSCNDAKRLYCIEDPVELGATSISGRVARSPAMQGRSITNALVTLTGSSLPSPRTFRTGRDGSYHFDNLESGLRYTLTASQMRHTFSGSPKTVDLVANVTDADFISSP